MSLDNTSHPGGPGSDELVPSRYALKVGTIDVMVVSDGVLPLPTPILVTNADVVLYLIVRQRAQRNQHVRFVLNLRICT